ncbi:hypothetical protein C2E23DRAFT_489303 [Lenzites betulinus]|nr:hypothetical protein C2E23DRAFT_489303 [Lenzites betulinus]
MTKYLRVMSGHQRASHRNTIEPNGSAPSAFTPHIDRLPDEILICIFECAHAAIFEYTYNDITEDNISRPLREWPQLLLVCTRWRGLLRSISHFWRVIPVAGLPVVLRDFILLSGNAPLDIRMLNEELALRAMPILGRACVASARSLLLFSIDPRPSNPGFYDELLNLDMPFLEVLTLTSANPKSDSPKRSILRSHQHYPSLRELVLCGLRAPHNITQLRTIHFTRCELPFSFDGFISTLSQCTQLVTLDLGFCLSSLNSIPTIIARTPRRAKLEGLRELTVQESLAHPLTAFLASIETPSVVYCQIECRETNPRREEDTRSFHNNSTIFRRLFTSGFSHLTPRFPPGPIMGYVYISDDRCTVAVGSDLDSAPPNIALLVARYDLDWKPVLSAALEDLISLFSDIPITTLLVEASPYYVQPAVWTKIFTALSSLQCLELTGDGTWIAMWQGLHRASADSPAGALCCPDLRSVRVDHQSRAEEIHPAQPDERDLEIIVTALQHRADVGGTRLEGITWRVRSLHHPDYYAVRGRFLARLSPFVCFPSYEDIENAD